MSKICEPNKGYISHKYQIPFHPRICREQNCYVLTCSDNEIVSISFHQGTRHCLYPILEEFLKDLLSKSVFDRRGRKIEGGGHI